MIKEDREGKQLNRVVIYISSCYSEKKGSVPRAHPSRLNMEPDFYSSTDGFHFLRCIRSQFVYMSIYLSVCLHTTCM